MKAFSVSRRQVRGQGMTEYIIIVALIAVAAIGVYNLFGKTVRNQTAGMSAALGGADTEAKTANSNGTKSGQATKSEADKTKSLTNFTDSVDAK